jgi:hypothetical protein
MKILSAIPLFFLISSCSIQSSQYNFIKNFTTDKNNTDAPKKNWSLFIENKKIDLYAINLDDQIIFADEDINIFFKNNQIYKATGLYSDITSMEIATNNNRLNYIADNKGLSTDICEAMIKSIQNKRKVHTIKCIEESSNLGYLNQIVINSDEQVIGLRYKIRPNYPSIELKYKQNINYN